MKYVPPIAKMPEIPADKLPVSEIFYSIQGEGRFAGCPALFVRLKYCNLGCSWCDTRFTWDSGKIETGELLTFEEIATNSLAQTGTNKDVLSSIHVVITGGEPMLHQSKLPSLISVLKKVGYTYFEIETNGMYVPTDEMTEAIDWWNCSPKLTNNGLDKSVNLIPEAIIAIKNTKKADFKFVIKNAQDLAELENDYIKYIPKENIMLMAEGWTERKQKESMQWVMKICQEKGLRFTPRLHILSWNNERGK